MTSILRLRNIASSSSKLTNRSFHTSSIARDHFLNVNAEAFKARALAKNAKPVLVDFYANWCQPCRLLTPVLKNLTGPESQYDLLTIDVDENPDVASEYNVSALPTVVAFKNGEKKDKFVGVLREVQIKEFLGKL